MTDIVPSTTEIQSLVQFPPAAGGGNALVVKSGGQINLEDGAAFFVGGNDVAAALAGLGLLVVGGQATLNGGGPVSVDKPFSTVLAFVATLSGNTAPGLSTSTLTVDIGLGGQVNIYPWKPTSETDPTLVDSDGTESFTWIAVGNA